MDQEKFNDALCSGMEELEKLLVDVIESAKTVVTVAGHEEKIITDILRKVIRSTYALGARDVAEIASQYAEVSPTLAEFSGRAGLAVLAVSGREDTSLYEQGEGLVSRFVKSSDEMKSWAGVKKLLADLEGLSDSDHLTAGERSIVMTAMDTIRIMRESLDGLGASSETSHKQPANLSNVEWLNWTK